VPDEKRAEPRRKTYLGGRIVQDDGISFPCVIRNASVTGAMVEMPPMTAVPDEWTLIDMKHALAHRVVVSWRQDERLGMRFTESFDLTGDLPEGLRHLQRLWAAERRLQAGDPE